MSVLFLAILFFGTVYSDVKLSAKVDSDGVQEALLETQQQTKPPSPKQQKPHSKLHIMWVTPFEIFNLSTKDNGIESTSLHESLAEYGLDMYNRFVEGVKSKQIKLSGLDRKASLNDKFFAFQQYLYNEKRLHITNQNIPKTTLDLLYVKIEQLCKIYLKHCGVDNEIIKDTIDKIKKREIFLWTSIHANGTYHPPHHHQDSIISGVYYVKIPKNMAIQDNDIVNEGDDEIHGSSGNFVLQDPRGAGIYPFGLRYIHEPVEGQMILFPSYVTHYVEPVRCKQPRISFSFNIPGLWDDLSDTSMFFDY